MTATTLVDRVIEDLVGLSDGSQNVIEVRGELWVVAQDLVPPQLGGHNNAHPRRIPGLSNWIACHVGRVSDCQPRSLVRGL
jgi:hypothetical protein